MPSAIILGDADAKVARAAATDWSAGMPATTSADRGR